MLGNSVVKFEISDTDHAKVREWLRREVYPEVISEQRVAFANPDPIMEDCWSDGYPYEGAIAGGLTYEFTPTSIGVIAKAKYGKYSLDLTDYESW